MHCDRNFLRVTQSRGVPGKEGIAIWKIDQLPPPSAVLPPDWHEKARAARTPDLQVTVKDFRRVHLVLIGDSIGVNGICRTCHHCILGTINLHPQDPNVFDLICPHCETIFCRVGDEEYPKPADIVIKCVCEVESHTNDLILCEICETWQHSSCYYDSGYPTRHQCRNCVKRAPEVAAEAES
jgi:hypothetical protein